jgi:hypothetical protein
VSCSKEWPSALIARSETRNSDLAARLYVLKLTHNPLWEDVDLGPMWRILHEAWFECSLGKSEDRFLASFKKPQMRFSG